jgi:hypothetical protein
MTILESENTKIKEQSFSSFKSAVIKKKDKIQIQKTGSFFLGTVPCINRFVEVLVCSNNTFPYDGLGLLGLTLCR